MSVSRQYHSLRGLGGQTLWVPIGGRSRGVPGSGGSIETINTSLNDLQIFAVPNMPGVSVTGLRVGFAGFDQIAIGAIDRSVSLTGGACSLILPAASGITLACSTAIASGATTVSFAIAANAPVNGISVGQVVTCAASGVPAGTFVSAIAFAYSGTSVTSCTVTLSATVTAAIALGSNFTFAGQVYPFTFGGARSNLRVDTRRDFVFSDPLPVEIPCDGRAITFKTFAQFSGPIGQISDFPSAASGSTRLAGEASHRSTSDTDGTLNQTSPSNSGAGYWGPHLILAQLSAPAPAVLVLGDSIAQGVGDAADANGRQGYVTRSLALSLPWTTLARGSTTAQQAVQSEQGSRGFFAAAKHCSATDVAILLGRNDIAAAARTAAQLKADLATLAAPYLAAGIRVRVATVPPTTSSTDAWATSGNQFWALQTPTLTAAASAGTTTVSVSSAAGIAVGQLFAVNTGTAGLVTPGTTVSAVSGTTITLSMALAGAITSGAQVVFGTATESGLSNEVQRVAYNADLRANFASYGYAGVVDVAAVLEDGANPGKWQTTGGAWTADGVHPNNTQGHPALISAGVIAPSRFSPPV